MSENSEEITGKTKAQLFTTSGIVLASIFGTVFAGGYLIDSNLKQLDEVARAQRVLLDIGLFFFLTLAACILLPD